MKIAILSDIHDQCENLRKALERCHIENADVLLCCGDLCAPFVIEDLGSGFAGPIHIVFGNNDADTFRITKNALKYPHITLHGEYAELELGGQKIALNHYDNIGRALTKGGTFDVVCFGHNHSLETKLEGNTWLINPGEIYGGRSGKATFVFYDTDTRSVEIVDLNF